MPRSSLQPSLQPISIPDSTIPSSQPTITLSPFQAPSSISPQQNPPSTPPPPPSRIISRPLLPPSLPLSVVPRLRNPAMASQLRSLLHRSGRDDAEFAGGSFRRTAELLLRLGLGKGLTRGDGEYFDGGTDKREGLEGAVRGGRRRKRMGWGWG
ncbi:hypothetical protein VTI74DRAFT_3974 [Chaetomium olivicolor]